MGSKKHSPKVFREKNTQKKPIDGKIAFFSRDQSGLKSLGGKRLRKCFADLRPYTNIDDSMIQRRHIIINLTLPRKVGFTRTKKRNTHSKVQK